MTHYGNGAHGNDGQESRIEWDMLTETDYRRYTWRMIGWALKQLLRDECLPTSDFPAVQIRVLIEDSYGFKYTKESIEEALYLLRVSETDGSRKFPRVYWSLQSLKGVLFHIADSPPTFPEPRPRRGLVLQ